MTRAFVAIAPPDSVLDAIAAFVARLPMLGARPTPREQWHLTLQFLGDDADVAAVEAAFARGPLNAGEHAVRVGGGVAFGDVRRARVLALGVQEGGEGMSALAAQVATRLLPLGFAPAVGERSFVPHLTVGRFREPTDVRPFLSALGDNAVGPPWRVDAVVLFESHLHSQGAQHRARATLPTGGAARETDEATLNGRCARTDDAC